MRGLEQQFQVFCNTKQGDGLSGAQDAPKRGGWVWGSGVVFVFKTTLPLAQRHIPAAPFHTLYIALKRWLTPCLFCSAAYQTAAGRRVPAARPRTRRGGIRRGSPLERRFHRRKEPLQAPFKATFSSAERPLNHTERWSEPPVVGGPSRCGGGYGCKRRGWRSAS